MGQTPGGVCVIKPRRADEKRRPEPESKAQSLTLGFVFFLSGAVALLYQAAWQRQFTLLFGSAAPATAVVLAAYFTGLGLGSRLLGKWSGRWSRPLRTYAILELIIAAGALAVTPLLSLYGSFYPGLFSLGEEHPALLVAAKGGLALLAILIPAAAMGGTLPVLAQLFEDRRDRLGELAGRLYMLNTAGAALGVLVFPQLLRLTGQQKALWICAGINVLLAGAGFLLAKARPTAPATPVPPIPARGRSLRFWLSLAFLSGFISFVLQVGWNRLFAQINENSLHSFSLIAALFIAAIAAGAALAGALLRRKEKWARENSLGFVWLTGGLLTMAAVAGFSLSSAGLQYRESLIVHAGWCIFLPVMFLSAAFPMILQKAAMVTQRRPGEVTGMVLGWNVAGSVAGALMAGFVLPATVGMWGILAVGGITALICGVIADGGRLLSRGWRIAMAVIAGLGCWNLWGRPRVRVESDQEEKLLALQEGPYGIAAVVEKPGSRKLKLNNHYGLGGSASAGDERMQAHLPILTHTGETSLHCLFLGYGTGISAGASLYYDRRQTGGTTEADRPFSATALELVPEVAALAGEYFAAENNGFSGHPRARVIHGDARNFLRGAASRYDVIVGDLVVPWRQGESALYTLEHFQAARARLNGNGLYCAWLPMYQLSAEEFSSILATFLQVFPATAVWRADFSPDQPAIGLTGYASGTFDAAAVQSRLENAGGFMQPDPLNPHLVHPAAVWMHYIGMVSPGLEPLADAPLNTEDHPVVELRTSRPPPFTGRRFQAWENRVRNATSPDTLPPVTRTGREAGRLMAEFTLLLSEGRSSEAAEIQKQIVRLLGEEAARSVFGG